MCSADGYGTLGVGDDEAMTADEILELARSYALEVINYVSRVEIGVQLGIIIVLYPIAALLARKIEPTLEERVQSIEGMPGLRRLLSAFLRRIKWIFFAFLLAIAYAAMAAAGWESDKQLVYVALVLSGAWLVISAISEVFRSPTLRKLFSLVAWGFVAATILGITGEIAGFMESVDFSLGESEITLLDLLYSVFLFGVLLWGALALGGFLERRLDDIEELTPSLRVLIGKVLRISLIVFAVLAALSSVGIDLTALTVFSGAIGVGIGFGLQKVVSNFISGIIILLDQSIKPGDTISLGPDGETFGWIRELRARFVSVVTRDGREFLIPNEDLITTQVVNWSFSDKYVRLDVPFGVSYDSDPHEVSRIAIEAAAGVERVDQTYKMPVCWMTEFGDSSINFLLRFWIHDPQEGLTNIRGKVLLALWDAFKEADINIPFPHREVIMKTPVTVEPRAKD